MMHRCSPDGLHTEVTGPDPAGRWAIVCVDCGTVLLVADDREELFADL
jgi:hypothetical protein